MKSYLVKVTYSVETCGYRNGEVRVDAHTKREACAMVRDDIKAGGHMRGDPSFKLSAREEFGIEGRGW